MTKGLWDKFDIKVNSIFYVFVVEGLDLKGIDPWDQSGQTFPLCYHHSRRIHYLHFRTCILTWGFSWLCSSKLLHGHWMIWGLNFESVVACMCLTYHIENNFITIGNSRNGTWNIAIKTRNLSLHKWNKWLNMFI